MLNAAVTINNNNSNTIYIAEGLETALSIAQAKPYDRVVASLSVTNLKNVPLPPNTQKIVLCVDYDGLNAQSHKALQAAADFYKSRGLEVAIAYPEKIPGMQKFDFNDVLKHLGVNSINKSLNNVAFEKSSLATETKIIESSKQQITKALNLNKEFTR